MTKLPQPDQVVRFSKVPAGSYCTAGVAYRVERSVDRRTKKPRGDFRFVNVETGSATFDRPWAVALAEWEVVA